MTISKNSLKIEIKIWNFISLLSNFKQYNIDPPKSQNSALYTVRVVLSARNFLIHTSNVILPIYYLSENPQTLEF